MSKILPTIGPITEEPQSLKKILKYCDLVRINGSHSTYAWHKKVVKKIRSIQKDAKILLDVPGIKPRTKNKSEIKIIKNSLVVFFYKSINKNIFKDKSYIFIEITNPLPKITQSINHFSVSDGQYKFVYKKNGKNYIVGKSIETFTLNEKKGLNIPFSLYDENEQQKIYLKFLEKFKNIGFNAVGLSFIQDDKIVNLIKKKYPNFLIVSKIENFAGLKNAKRITKNSDVIMIDRGDLSAEIGEKNLYQAILNIASISHDEGKPLIMATENLDSMMIRKTPTKSEIMSLGHSLQLDADKIMLSDETATSKNWFQIIKWLDNFINLHEKNKRDHESKNRNQIFWNILDNIVDIPVVIFSKKGFALEQISKLRKNIELTVFTDNSKVATLCMFRSNTRVFQVDNFDKSQHSKHIYSNIKKYKNIIFKNNKQALLIYVAYPRKNSRANTLSLITIEDFSK